MILCMWKKRNDTIEEGERRESRNGNTEEGRGVFMVAEKRMLSVCCPRLGTLVGRMYDTVSVQRPSWLRA
jgi:hypothetical protein